MPTRRPDAGRQRNLKIAAALSLAVLLAGGALLAPPAPLRGGGARPVHAARLDLHRDPLPHEALLRLGSLRLRTGGPVFAVLSTPDGKGVYAGSATTTVFLWDAATGKELRRFDAPPKAVAQPLNVLTALALSPDGRTLAAGSRGGSLYLWGVATGTLLRTLPGRQAEVQAVAFSPDGKLLASTAGRLGDGGEILVRDAAAGTEIRRLRGHRQVVYRLAFSPDGKLLAAAGQGGTVRLWDPATGRLVRAWAVPENAPITVLVFSPDGKTLATAGWRDCAPHLWEVATGKLRLRLPDPTIYRALAFSPDGKILATNSGAPGFIALWEIRSGEQIELIHANAFVRSLAFLPRRDRLTLAAGTPDGTVGLWDLPGSAALLRPDRVGRTARALHRFGHQGTILSLAVAPDGKILVTGSDDHTTRFWDATTGGERACLEERRGSIRELRYSPDGRLLA